MRITLAIAAALIATPCLAWDGYDYDAGAHIEIDKGNLVRSGETIEIFDYDSGEYRDVDVESVESNGDGATVEVYDPTSNEYRTFEMD